MGSEAYLQVIESDRFHRMGQTGNKGLVFKKGEQNKRAAIKNGGQGYRLRAWRRTKVLFNHLHREISVVHSIVVPEN